jgi:hypothetical protein
VTGRSVSGTGTRSGLMTAGLWLIGIGAVLAVRELTGWSWGEAWPMFLIVVGVIDLTGKVADLRQRRDPWSLTGPIVWIAIGGFVLAATTGALGTDPVDVVLRSWPWAAIALGAWLLVGSVVARAAAAGDSLDIPLAAGASDAAVVFRYGGGRLTVGPAGPGVLLTGTFTGGVKVSETGPNRYQLDPASGAQWSWLEGRSSWDVLVTSEVPLDVRLETGATRTELNLAETMLRDLTIKTGASETHVLLPRAAGLTHVSVESGAASITLTVPDGVAARIRGRMALGSINAADRFARVGDGFESPNFDAATNRVEVSVSGGVGSLQVL